MFGTFAGGPIIRQLPCLCCVHLSTAVLVETAVWKRYGLLEIIHNEIQYEPCIEKNHLSIGKSCRVAYRSMKAKIKMIDR